MMILVLFVKDFVNSTRIHMIWTILHGPYSMAHTVWVILYDSYMDYGLAVEYD